MNLKEQLAGKVEIIGDLKLQTEEGDEQAAEDLATAIEEAKGIQARIEAADEAAEMLKGLATTTDKKEAAKEDPKTLGEFAMKSLDLSAMAAGTAKSAGTGYGFKAATDVHVAPAIVATDNNVIDIVPRQLNIRDLFGAESISGNALTYFQMGATEGAPEVVAEGATKPQLHVPSAPVTVPLTKVAGWFYETDELLSDAPFLRSAIDNRGLYELALAVEKYLTTTLLGTSGIQTLAPEGAQISADDLFKAITNVQTATGYAADAIVLNPADYQVLRLAKDSNLQYYGGGYFYGAYGNSGVVEQPGIWGLRTVVSTALDSGTALVGAFKAGGSVVGKAGEGASIEVHRGDHDDAINNRVTVVVEERLALATRIPAAFVKVSA